MTDAIGTMLAQPGHSLATSALPNAPVVDEPAPRMALRAAIAAALRTVAAGSQRLADRVAPAGSRYSTA